MCFNKGNLQDVLSKIKQAASSAGRAGSAVTLIAVTKTVDSATIREAIASGITVIGESRVQEAQRKWEELGPAVSWHLVGHLQTNKVKKAVRMFDLIHSVDSAPLAREISRRAGEIGKVQPVLVQVNTSGEPAQYGVAPDRAAELLREAVALPCLAVKGLMTIGAFRPDPEQVRPCFKLLSRLRDELQPLAGESLGQLSMGMTNDYEAAIQEGATLVRIGRALFGGRA